MLDLDNKTREFFAGCSFTTELWGDQSRMPYQLKHLSEGIHQLQPTNLHIVGLGVRETHACPLAGKVEDMMALMVYIDSGGGQLPLVTLHVGYTGWRHPGVDELQALYHPCFAGLSVGLSLLEGTYVKVVPERQERIFFTSYWEEPNRRQMLTVHPGPHSSFADAAINRLELRQPF